MKLLIIDDEPLIIKGIRSFIDFKALGISEVFEAPNGEIALQLFSEHLPDLVLADINMPKMNGLEFSKLAKAKKPDVKIGIITGYDYFDYAVAALKAGVDDYILKPVSKGDIQEVLKKLVQRVREEKNQSEVKALVQEMAERTATLAGSYGLKLQKLMEDNYRNRDFSLSVLANLMALSPGYLSNLFKSVYGIAFQDYLRQIRLDQAKILLLSTDLKIYEIAEAVGFDDPNYFSATFKHVMGCSPNQFREREVKE